jgi:hypothetical protein
MKRMSMQAVLVLIGLFTVVPITAASGDSCSGHVAYGQTTLIWPSGIGFLNDSMKERYRIRHFKVPHLLA